MDVQTELRQEARKLLEEKRVDLVIGYEDDGTPLRTTPCFIREPQDVDRLVWNPFCEYNLVKYLAGRKDKVAMVAKGCDTRTLVVLINENQIKRENVCVIGMPCGGIVDRRKIYAYLKDADVTEAVVENNVIKVKGPGFENDLKIDDFLADCCLSCRHKSPVLCDVGVGEKAPEAEIKEEYESIKLFEKNTPEQRWEYFKSELSKCIRCYACREACPLCYCKQCFVDQSLPAWVGKTTDISDTMAFQIMRALHTTGRCVDCGACVRACPNNIDLRKLTQKIEKDVKELFGDEAGLSLEEKAPLTEYRENDPQDFIK